MRLTNLLLGKYKFVKGIPGNIWIGKHRFVPPVTRNDRVEMYKRFMYEEEVMMYLKNPYVTEEDEKLYLETHAEPQPKEFFGKWYTEPSKLEPLNQRTVAFHLGQLNHTRSWGEHEPEE